MTDGNEPTDPNLGRVIADKFQIESQLGFGSVGTVYRATHLQLKRAVALKTLRASLAADPSTVARFTREAQLASQLDHPNIVRVYDYGTQPDGLTYLAMELLEGCEISAMIGRGEPLPSERIVHVMAQVLAALAVAHRLGIVHRDLKPENIMLVTRVGDDGAPAEVVKVTDFGIARTYGEAATSTDAITRFGSVSGTPQYMSPEQALADELDGRSDLYACGVMLYEMLCGQVPFVGDGPLEILEKHLKSPVVPPSKRRAGVDLRLEPIAMRALAKNRDDRYPDAAAMRTALLAALEQPLELSSKPQSNSSVLIELSPESVIVESAPSIILEAAPDSVMIESGASVLMDQPDTEPAPTPSRAPPVRRKNRSPIWAVLGVLLAAGAAATAWWFLRARPATTIHIRTEPVPASVDAGIVPAHPSPPPRPVRRPRPPTKQRR